MRNSLLSILIAIILAGFVLFQASGQSGSFIISGADAVVYSDLVETAAPNVEPRFVVQYANGMKFIDLPPFPDVLLNLLRQVKDRFVFQYADANRYIQLDYPVGLVGDTDPPAIQNLLLSKNWAVTWDTDELATGVLSWGDHSGAYTHTISNTLYATSHQLQMDSLTPGAIYFFIVKSSDRSNNTAQSDEKTFVADTSITGLTASNDGPTNVSNQTILSASLAAGTNVVFSWNFGDGTTGSGQTATHVYSSTGTYIATVTATNSVSTSNAQTTVTVFKPVVKQLLFIPLNMR
jgi:hypothetical protein